MKFKRLNFMEPYLLSTYLFLTCIVVKSFIFPPSSNFLVRKLSNHDRSIPFQHQHFHRLATTDQSSEEAQDSLLQTDTIDDTSLIEDDFPEYIIDYSKSFTRVKKFLGLNVSLLLQHHEQRQQEQTYASSFSSKLPLAATDLFCNRELNMENIQAVGFDMDYTLAQYKEEFDLLAYEGAKEKLISLYNYPTELKSLVYEPGLCRRGCILDTERGNILKLDQHRYPRVVEHGLTAIGKEERKEIYRESYQEFDTFNQEEFINLDTPFSLVDAILYLQLVDLKDRLLNVYNQSTAFTEVVSSRSSNKPSSSSSNDNQENFLSSRVIQFIKKSYSNIWYDLRKCIDRCHKDGVIKLTVAKNPAKYIYYDPNLFPMLQKFKRYNKKVFLLTNSLWEYTQVVMNYLEGKKVNDEKDFQWTEYFDLIIVGGNKPAFMLDEGALSLYRINPLTNNLQNIEVLPSSHSDVQSFLKEGKIFQGGNAQILHSLLQVPSGDTILYTGDHIYADVLRSKRSLGWRTCLIVPELTKEIQINQMLIEQREVILTKRKQQYLLENQSDQLYLQIIDMKKLIQKKSKNNNNNNNNNDGDDKEIIQLDILEKELISIKLEIYQLKLEIDELILQYHYRFHNKWGQLFKARFQESRLAKQITDFACLYTSKASNLGYVSPLRTFRPANDKMSHDHVLEGL